MSSGRRTPELDRRRREARSATEREQRIAAAIATLETAGLNVTHLDDQSSLVAGPAGEFEWHRATHHWKKRGAGHLQGFGLIDLIKAAKAGASGA